MSSKQNTNINNPSPLSTRIAKLEVDNEDGTHDLWVIRDDGNINVSQIIREREKLLEMAKQALEAIAHIELPEEIPLEAVQWRTTSSLQSDIATEALQALEQAIGGGRE